MKKKYKKVTAGGTFDRLHQGHERLLERAFELSDKVAIGLTTNQFVKYKQLSQVILPYSERQKQLENYASKLAGQNDRYRIVKLDDVYGTTLIDREIEAMVVTEETLPGAMMVNSERQKKGWEELPVEKVELVVDEEGERLSSERIREGVVARDGRVFGRVFEKDWVMSVEQRRVLKNPMAELVKNGQIVPYLARKKYTKVVLVGDRCLLKFKEMGLEYDAAIFDGRIKRKIEKETEHFAAGKRLEVENQAGGVEKRAVEVIKELIGGDKRYLKVEGEEDLLVLPLVLSLPLESAVIYGQPNEGSVVVEVTEESKERWYSFLAERKSKFLNLKS